MYTEEPRRRIDWGNVLRKIVVLIIIVLIVLLIIWLFNRSNYDNNINKKYNNNNTKLIDKNNNNDNNNNNNNSGLQNPNLYSESFVVNYKYFHDTARDFVEKNNRWFVCGLQVTQRFFHNLNLLFEVGVGDIHHVYEQVGLPHFVECRLE